MSFIGFKCCSTTSLGSESMNVVFSRNHHNVSNDTFLYVGDGVSSNTSSVIIPYNGKISYISVSCGNSSNFPFDIELYDNGSPISGTNYTITSTIFFTNLSVNVPAGCLLQIKLTAVLPNKAAYPIVNVIINKN
jgi:hypothetical protein